MRTCDYCGKNMIEGFCIFDGEQYYCSEECLHTVYTQAEYDLLYETDCAYWTDWEEDDVV